MKKIITIVISLVFVVSLAGCGQYVSSYKAVGFVHANESSSAYMNFVSFDGEMAFKLKCKEESDLKYTAKLESGSAVIFCDCDGTPSELFSLQNGDEVDSYCANIKAGTVYIIVETYGECLNGDIRFGLE